MHASNSVSRFLRQSTLVATAVVGLAGSCVAAASAPAAERTAQQKSDDKAIAARVRDALDADSVKFPDVRVMTFAGITQLAGFVDSNDHRARAADIAKRVLGDGRLENAISVKDDQRKAAATNLPERSAGEIIDDKKITAAVATALSADSLKYPEVHIAAFRGVVQLSGFTGDAETKNRAGEVAKKAAGVRKVENNITVIGSK